MGRTKTASWVGGTVVLAVLILVVAWFVAISPKLAAASTAREQTTDVESQNTALQIRIDGLRDQFARLDDYRAELADVRRGLPEDAELPSFIDQLQEIADEHGVFLGEIATEPALDVVPPEPPAPASPQPQESADGDEGTGGGTGDGDGDGDGAAQADASASDPSTAPADQPDATPGAGTAPPVIEGFVAMPVRFTVYGAFTDVRDFLRAVQTEIDRLYLVTSLVGTSLREEPARNGLPAFERGDVELIIDGFAYVLRDLAAGEGVAPGGAAEDAGDAEGTVEVGTELPSGGTRNPFDPVGTPVAGSGAGDDD